MGNYFLDRRYTAVLLWNEHSIFCKISCTLWQKFTSTMTGPICYSVTKIGIKLNQSTISIIRPIFIQSKNFTSTTKPDIQTIFILTPPFGFLSQKIKQPILGLFKTFQCGCADEKISKFSFALSEQIFIISSVWIPTIKLG